MMMSSTLPNQSDVRPSNPPINQPKNSSSITSVARPGRNNANCKSNQKKKSLEIWDTDFDGAWEMGRDLIREFVLKQNNRNRSISESDAARFTAIENDAVIENAMGTENETIVLSDQMKSAAAKGYDQLDDDEENLMRVAAAATSALFGKPFDMNMYPLGVPDTETVSCSSQFTDSSLFMQNNNDKMLVRSEGYATPDTLGSWSETDTAALRRERDHEPMNCTEIAKGYGTEIGSDCVDSGCDENNYLAAFEAKFNHNVEALWNDCKPSESQGFGTMKNDAQLNHSFWPNYQNNNVIGQSVARPPKMTTEQFRQFFQENNQLQPCSTSNNVGGIDRSLFTATQPNSLNSNSSSTGGMNLTTSIWTDNPNNNEDDISFYANARLWEMNQSKALGQKLNFYANEQANNNNNLLAHNKVNTVTSGAAASNFDTRNYENSSFSKWSDTEIPFLPNQQDICMSPPKTNEEKIRSNLFGNSYFYNYQSSSSAQLMNNNATNGQIVAHAETNNIAEQSVSQMPKVETRKVTLLNHSSGSCFKEVEPLSSEAKEELYCKINSRKLQATSVEVLDNEDLLTSERSRFRPIKQTYADGYTFDISNKLDQISYERSRSGMLYHDSEVYREYYVYDEEGNGGSRCDTETNAPAEFTLKYCVRQNDKSCQTDDLPSMQSEPQFVFSPKILLSLKATDSNRMQSAANAATANNNNNSLSSANISSLQNHRMYFQCNDSNDVQYDDINSDTYDKLAEMSQESWCLAENRQCCNNNNNAHALWEHCATCSNDVISMPANSRLKDELSADGDEIMSDLKYLIESISFHSDWEDPEADSPTDCAHENDVLMQTLNAKITDASRNLLTDATKPNGDGFGDVDDDEFASNHIYSNVSKLISDLLQPEKAQTLVQAISEKCQGRLLTTTDEKCAGSTQSESMLKKRITHKTKDVQTTKNDKSCNSSPEMVSGNANSGSYFGSLWAYNDNSIWRKELPAEINGKHIEDEAKSANRFSEQWEHANLEKIWKCLPTTTTTTTTTTTATTTATIRATASSSETPTENTGDNKQQHLEMDQMNYPTSLQNDSKSTNQPSALDLNEHTKLSCNTLEKFMNLLRQQSNAKGQCPASAHHSKNHQQQTHKNPTRSDRKRRHSATSQNYFDQLNYPLNNCDAIESIKKLATKTLGDYNGCNIFNCAANDKSTTTTIITCKYWTACDSFCLTSTLAFNNNNNNFVDDTENIFNCYHKQKQQQQQHSKYQPEPTIMDTLNATEPLTINSTTFLAKQMAAMASRPLTR
ncbi:uncharacterized protein LOC129565554 isoform X2 [Sitodiplosis mosellana]|nr:uncharacterized protein LOC129565554 isoform X2 [Sitodiplosis mosellana]